MKVAFINKAGELELRWMWLPTFISQNYGLMQELQTAWKKAYPEGVIEAVAEHTAHVFSIRWLQERLKIKGLDHYLGAIEYVEEG